jgi:ABC-2 type transport system ATP-binding protein
MPRSYQQNLKELADVLGLPMSDFEKPIKSFSGGMKRKLEIIRSLIHKPKVLFLDEPTVGLDPLSRRQLWEYLNDVRRKQDTTVFLTTHYLDEAEDADVICIINQGKIVTIGTPNQVKAELAKEYVVVDASDRSALKRELESKKIEFTINDGFTIPTTMSEVQQIIKSIDTPLASVTTHAPSLEDAYLEIIGHEAAGGNGQ